MGTKSKNKPKAVSEPTPTAPTERRIINTHAEVYVEALREHGVFPPLPPDPPRGSVTEGRDITAAFTELIREGKVCQYRLLRLATPGGAFKQGDPPGLARQYWEGFGKERDGLLRAFRKDGGAEGYGSTLDRALQVWKVATSRPPTAEEGREERERLESWGELPADFVPSDRLDLREVSDPDDPSIPQDDKVFRAVRSAATDDCHRLWIEEFGAEVEVCVERFKDDDELPYELGRLVAELKAFEVCSGEGRVLVEHLQTTGVGLDVLRKVADGKARLLLRLEEIAANVTSGTPTATVVINGQPIPWRGSVQVLAWLLRELAEKDWIDAPRHSSTTTKYTAGDINASAFTKAMAPHFPVNATALGQELKAEGGTVPAQDVEDFKIPQRPK